jgi:hypothetical protein
MKNKSNKRNINIVIYSTDTAVFMNNKILDRAFMAKHHHGEALTDLAEAIIDAGYHFMTLDIYLSEFSNEKALLISDMGSGISSLKSPNIIPAVSFSLESPVIATRYYHSINSRAKSFRFILDWKGIANRIKDSDQFFLEIFHPNKFDLMPLEVENWSNKKFMVIINSNKLALQWHWPFFAENNYFSYIKALASNIRTQWIKLIDPQITTQLYFERLKAIQYFSQRDDFDLYGYGWGDLNNFSISDYQAAISKVYRGPIKGNDDNKDKVNILKKYKFSIVYENAIFPGYITEKIFDCFSAGVIPIYMGDPTIQEIIPNNTFIDLRNFKNFKELELYIDQINKEEAIKYLKAAHDFIHSIDFESYTSANFSKTIISCLDRCQF